MIKIFNYNNFFKLISIILVLGFFVFFLFSSQAASSSSDAIAIRVIPNPNHYSALRWYNEQGFYGSPQSLTVDGYEAVRDGRTVYVNAANISASHLYTNIYLISYNQKAESATVDIFSQILSHWQFNINITSLGHCRYAAIGEDNFIPCLRDNECPAGDFCDSAKARIIRDTRRLADLAEIKFILDNYKIVEYYPILGAGTYLPHKTLSVWPSWQETLSDELNVSLPIDPVNKLGDCPGYNEITCWDEETKQFAEAFPDLPDDSLAYTYTTDVNGTLAEVCAVFESGLILTGAPACFLTGVCLDFDEDGWGIYDSGVCPETGADCDDTNPAIHAASGPEVCDNGIDDDCDGLTDCNDSDCDTHPACSAAMCVPDGCNGNCPFNCSGNQDPDCDCTSGNGCCGFGCTNAQDTDCPAICVFDGCNSICPPGCTVNEDPDCGCQDNDGCCGLGCDIANDNDCPPICIDSDGDGHYAIDIFCPAGDDCDDVGPNAAKRFPGNPEICDGIDNDCVGGADDGLSEEDCAFVCLALSPLYDYNAGRSGDLQCCGDDAGEDNPYEGTEASCSDGNDNDCDGFIDMADSDCSGICNNVGEHDWINAATPGDCNQCDWEGDQDGDQTLFGEDWSPYPGMVDLCDVDCGTVAATVQLANYEDGDEVSCDGIDNDCDGFPDENCCTDGTPYNQCSTSMGPPFYCDGIGNLIENCGNCGCSGSWVCGPIGTFCCDNICNLACSPVGCTVAEDPDCGCLDNDGCCGIGCDDSNDNDCLVICLPDGCNGTCPTNCTVADDPDCGCQDNNGCCGIGCDFTNDNDCPIPCVPDGCNANCPTNCTVADDPDCGCLDNDGCCGIGCDSANDNDCIPSCIFTFTFPCVFP